MPIGHILRLTGRGGGEEERERMSKLDYSKFRYPGEFEPQTDVFINWLPDYCAGDDGDRARGVLVEMVRNLLGHVNVHINCGCETSLEACKAMLESAGIDTSDPGTSGQRNTSTEDGEGTFSPYIRFTQFDDWSVSIRDNGPDVMIDDKDNALAVNMRWSNYSNNDKMEPAQQLARRAGAQMAIDLDVFEMVNSDMVSEGGNREFNGAGVMISVEDTEVNKRNREYTKEQIEAEYKRVWNLDKIIWIPKPLLEDDDIRKGPIDEMDDGTLVWPGSFAAHTDEYCRFVAEDTVLLAEVTEQEAATNKVNAENKRRIDAAYEILKCEKLPDGRPLKIVRMPFPKHLIFRGAQDNPTVLGWKQFFDENGGKAFDGTPWPEGDYCFINSCSYCNFLVCNDVVLGQKYWHEGMDPEIKVKDERVEAVFNQIFPGRKVVMLDTYSLNLFGGGVHCWTKNVALR